MKKICFIVIFTLFIQSSVASPSCGQQEEWVNVSSEDLSKDDWRRHSENNFGSARLDMNGDGIGDEAALVVSQDAKRSAIRICFGIKDGKADMPCHVIADSENIYSVMGLERRDPGCYEYHEDDEGNVKMGEVCSKFDILEYFRFASSSSFFIYDENDGEFHRYWDSH